MKTHVLRAALLAAVADPCALCAQGLLYTTRTTETGTQCPAQPDITNVAAGDIEHIVPAVPPAQPAAFLTREASEVLWGDQDLDATHIEPALFGGIDALVPPFVTGGALVPPNGRNVWFSPSVQTTAVAGALVLHPAALGRVLPGGALELFVDSTQVYAAFGLPVAANANIDAAAMIWGVGLFLSFETTANINTTFHGAVAVADGAILAVPFSAITWGTSAYDAAAVVASIAPGSGVIVLGETQVNARVAASGIRDHTGTAVLAVGDLDGLEADPLGGSFQSQSLAQHQLFAGGVVPNLIFCGLNLTGGGIVSTSGTIAVIHGVPMGSAATATTGAELGLVTAGGVGSLNGLGLTDVGISRFVTHCTPQLLTAGAIDLQVASDPGGLVLGLLQFPGVAGAGTVDPSLSLAPFGPAFGGFPDLCPLTGWVLGDVLFGGCGAMSPVILPAGVYPTVIGTRLVFQAVHITAAGVFELSTPSAAQFY